MLTCFARSTAVTTCCWCWKNNDKFNIRSWKHCLENEFKISEREIIANKFYLTSCDKNGSSCAIIAFRRFAISICNERINVAVSVKLRLMHINYTHIAFLYNLKSLNEIYHSISCNNSLYVCLLASFFCNSNC